MSCNFPCCYAFIKCKQVLVLSFLAFLTKLLQVDRVCLAKPATQTQYSTTISKATIFEKSWCSKTKFGSPFQETAYMSAIIFQQKKYVELTFVVNPKDILAKCKFRSINLIWPFELALVNRLCNWK